MINCQGAVLTLFHRQPLGVACVHPTPPPQIDQLTNADPILLLLILLRPQLLFFAALAVMVMRLKLFWTPHLCLSLGLLVRPLLNWFGQPVVTSTNANTRTNVADEETAERPASKAWYRRTWCLHSVLVALVAMMACQGWSNLKVSLVGINNYHYWYRRYL